MTLLQRDRENIEQGREEGAKEMADLTKILLNEGRSADLERALDDAEFRKELFQEYNI